MDKNVFKYSKLTDMSVEMQTQEQKNMTLLRGKALLNEDESRLTFIQNTPRGPRSVEIGRTQHSRMVRRPDGDYTLTFRFSADEKQIREQMIAEVRNAINRASEDIRTQNAKTRKEEKK